METAFKIFVAYALYVAIACIVIGVIYFLVLGGEEKTPLDDRWSSDDDRNDNDPNNTNDWS